MTAALRPLPEMSIEIEPVGGVATGPPAEVRRLAELGPAGVAGTVERDVGRSRPHGVHPGDGGAVVAQDLTVDRDPQPTHREAGVEGLPGSQVVGPPGALGERHQPLLGLVERRVVPLGVRDVPRRRQMQKILRRLGEAHWTQHDCRSHEQSEKASKHGFETLDVRGPLSRTSLRQPRCCPTVATLLGEPLR